MPLCRTTSLHPREADLRKTIPSDVLRAVACFALPGIAATVLLLAPRAEAIPAFARKYETSCQTCHTVFPKLNAFGTAFRLNGYRMPASRRACPNLVHDRASSPPTGTWRDVVRLSDMRIALPPLAPRV